MFETKQKNNNVAVLKLLEDGIFFFSKLLEDGKVRRGIC